MTTMQLTFDTLAYANKLKAAGIDPKQAEAQAAAQSELLENLVNNQLATKQDLRELEIKLERRINKLETSTKLMENRIIVKLGSLMIISIGALATLMTIFHLH